MPFLATLKQAQIRVIGKSAGGRDIIAVEYGAKENPAATSDNLPSSLAAYVGHGGPDQTRIFPESFYGAKRRTRPVLAIQGGLHGGELTGTAAALNLCKIMETGTDLRGKAWPKLRELAQAARIVIVPWLNIDGAERWPLANTSDVPDELYSRCLMGVGQDGVKYVYPQVKNIFPIPPERTAFMGCYFNDAGVNLQYDFCQVRRQPETTAWMEYYLAERPDGVLIAHCNAGSMLGPPEAYLPEGFQHEYSRLAGALRSRLTREGLNTGRSSWAGLPGMGQPFLDQINAVYHVCGAMPMLCEFPAGTHTHYYSCDQMLDIGLLALEEILFYAHTDGLRPYEFWAKVKQQMQKKAETKKEKV